MKWIGRIVIALVIIVVLALVGLYVMLDTIATNAVAKAGTHATGVETTVDSVHIGVFSGEVSLDNLTVANPEGFASDRFMSLGEGEIAVGLGSLMSDTVDVGLIRLDNLTMNLEENADGQYNFQVISDHLAKLSDPDAPKSPEPAEDSAAGKKFIVQQILITNVNVNATVGGQKIPVVIPKIELTDVGSADGAKQVTMSEIMSIIIGATFKTVMTNPQLPAAMLGSLGDGLKDLGSLGDVKIENIGEITEGVGGLIKGVPGGEDLGGTVDDLGKEADKVTDKLEGLGGLLGGKKDEQKKEEPSAAE